MPARAPSARIERTVPAVPTPVVSVVVTDLRRRAAPVVVLVAPGEDEQEGPWFGPGSESLPDNWRDSIYVSGLAGEVSAPAPGAGVRWLLGVGARRPVDWRSAGAALARSVRDAVAAVPMPTVDVALPAGVSGDELTDLVLGLTLGAHGLRITAGPAPAAVRTIRLCVEGTNGSALDGLRAAVHRAGVLGRATALARDLSNMPSNVKNPAWLASTAARVTAGLPGLTATVHDERWLAEQGFGGVLAVGGGSASPPRLIELAWRPGGSARAPHLVLVGKGVTFDTGGISLKPAANMHLMRTDMSGAAAVIAAVRAIAQLGLPLRVTAVAPAAENHVSGSSYRPGDIVRHYGGRTTAVTNTDAEGRMLLADGLAYAAARLSPDLVVDVATLTGAMKVSLGLRTGGVFASSDAVAERVGAAGVSVGESWWRMPLLDDLVDEVAGELADVRQAPRGPGAVVAALFLREFTDNVPWAHLDVAGPARADATFAEVVPGATGFAARTLIAIAESLVEHPTVGRA